jgi:hypothetical protein
LSEFFIVLSRPVEEFETLPEALIHQRDLERHVPDAEHRVYRCKRWLAGAKHFTKMLELLVDIQRDGLTNANRDRIRVLMFTISNRTPKLQTLITAPGPAEYRPPAGGRTGA